MRFLLLALALAAVGCDRIQNPLNKPKSAEDEKKDQQQGTEDAAKDYAKTIVLQRLGVSEADFSWGMKAKQTAAEVTDIWWEVTGKVKTKNTAGENVSQEFSVTAVKPINSNRWKWVMCTIGDKSFTNAP
jgi:hypothetical protein